MNVPSILMAVSFNVDNGGPDGPGIWVVWAEDIDGDAESVAICHDKEIADFICEKLIEHKANANLYQSA